MITTNWGNVRNQKKLIGSSMLLHSFIHGGVSMYHRSRLDRIRTDDTHIFFDISTVEQWDLERQWVRVRLFDTYAIPRKTVLTIDKRVIRFSVAMVGQFSIVKKSIHKIDHDDFW